MNGCILPTFILLDALVEPFTCTGDDASVLTAGSDAIDSGDVFTT